MTDNSPINADVLSADIRTPSAPHKAELLTIAFSAIRMSANPDYFGGMSEY